MKLNIQSNSETMESATMESVTMESATMESETLESETMESEIMKSETMESATMESETMESKTMESVSVEHGGSDNQKRPIFEPIRSIFKDMRLFHPLFTEFFCTMGYRCFCNFLLAIFGIIALIIFLLLCYEGFGIFLLARLFGVDKPEKYSIEYHIQCSLHHFNGRKPCFK